MAIIPKDYYFVYELRLSEGQIDELEDHIRSGRSEYVAGKLLGMLKSNFKKVDIEKPKEGSIQRG